MPTDLKTVICHTAADAVRERDGKSLVILPFQTIAKDVLFEQWDHSAVWFVT